MPYSATIQTRQGIKFLTIPTWQAQGVKIGFSLRYGGISQGAFSSFNQGLHVGDQNEAVLLNRRRFLHLFAGTLEQAVCCEQVHGNRIYKVGAADRGKGARSSAETIKNSDALITDVPEVYLLGFFADCLPICLYAPEQRVIGLAHSGWKGTFGDIAGNVVAAMSEQYQIDPAHMWAYIFPGIHRECFVVGENLVQQITREKPELLPFMYKEHNDWHWDLYASNQYLLERAGIASDNIGLSDICTACHPEDFFSYRREAGITGRMAAVIALSAIGSYA